MPSRMTTMSLVWLKLGVFEVQPYIVAFSFLQMMLAPLVPLIPAEEWWRGAQWWYIRP